MKLTTAIPVTPVFFKHWHTDDTEIGIVVVKACFMRRPDGGFRSDGKAPELCLEDVFEGDVATSPLLQEQDIAPGKRGTDLLIRAIARSPQGKAMADWPVRIQIADRLSYGFQVRGPSEWRRGLTGWKLTAPELVHEVPVSYALAYGGTAPSGDDKVADDIYEHNPAGIGYATDTRLKAREPFAAPQIGELAEFIAADATAEMGVHGSGPIAKAWLPRRGHAGTFDEDWQQGRHPRMPDNYSLQFWNAAPSVLQLMPALAGNEVVEISGVSHVEDVRIKLPTVGLFLRASTGNVDEEEVLDMVLDTVDIDVTKPDPADHKITMIWRANVEQPNRFLSGTIESRKLEA